MVNDSRVIHGPWHCSQHTCARVNLGYCCNALSKKVIVVKRILLSPSLFTLLHGCKCPDQLPYDPRLRSRWSEILTVRTVYMDRLYRSTRGCHHEVEGVLCQQRPFRDGSTSDVKGWEERRSPSVHWSKTVTLYVKPKLTVDTRLLRTKCWRRKRSSYGSGVPRSLVVFV